MQIIMWIASVLVIIFVIFVIVINIGRIIFDRKVKGEVKKLFAEYHIDRTKVITKEDLIGLPEPIQKWLQKSQIIGKEKIVTVKLKQKGLFKTKKEKPWIPFKAEQYYNTDVPGFIWYATMKPAPLLTVKGRDMYYDGRGNMLIKLLSSIKIADASGPEIDQGTLLRYLNEIMWFPTAALNDYIEWQSIDQKSAMASMNYKGVKASAIYYFNEDGDLINFVAERYMDINGDFKIEKWSTPISDYREFNGIRIPSEGEAVWKLDSGDFSYIKIKLIDIDYNNPTLY